MRLRNITKSPVLPNATVTWPRLAIAFVPCLALKAIYSSDALSSPAPDAGTGPLR